MVHALRRRTEIEGDRAADPDAVEVAAAVADPRAFAVLYLRYVDPVYRYCLRRLGSREAAEDATSMTFTRALAGLPAYRAGRSTFRSWLFAVARNVVADEWRGRRPADRLGEDLDVADPAPTPEAVAAANEAGREVRALLARLPAGQADVVALRLAGLTGPEIVGALGRSPNTVKVAQYRAYARLRELLGEKEVGDGGG
jgi:RNA polymerase sigma-70 factor (ECF subfamily)